MKIVQVNVKDLESFIKKINEHGYNVEYGLHTVLTDHSELMNISFMKNNRKILILIAHYITKQYLLENKELSNENYVDKALRLKNNSSEWSIPVNPVIAIVLDNEVINILLSYRDKYPIDNGEELVNSYRARNPSYRNIPRLLFIRILEELRGED